MSDFFMPKNTNGYWDKQIEKQNESIETNSIVKPEENTNTETVQKTSPRQPGYWDKKAEEYNKKYDEHFENWNRYGIEVPDEYYEQFNKIISKAETPELAQEEAYRIGSAIKYSKMYGMPLLEAYQHVDEYNAAQFSHLTGQKARYEALSDMFNLGVNNVKLGNLGQKLMTAHREGDTELAQALMAEIDALNKQNVLMQDNAPRTWVMESLEACAQSLPFTGAVASAGIIGNFIAPAVGTGAAFAASSYLASGQEYIDMLNNGATPETARFISGLSGLVQGLIEADLGITAGIVKGSARVMGKEAAESFAKKTIGEIEKKVFKRFHFGAGKKLAINFIENYGKNLLGEGTEEFLQEITSIVGQEIAGAMDGYNIPDDDFKSIVKQTTEAFRGGVLGALSMGFIPAGLNGAADIKEYKKIKDGAEGIESAEAFKNAVKDNPVFEGMSEDVKSDTINEIWKRAQQHKEEMAEASAKAIAETTDFAEGAELKPEAEEGEEAQVEAAARGENGRLMIQENESKNEDGTTSVTFAAGDRTKETDNRYGYITADVNEDNKTVTIDAFKMALDREGLRAELYDEFARKYAGYTIEWNTKSSAATAIKEDLIKNNPSGVKGGLNYYSEADLDDIETSKRVAQEIKANIHNFVRQADGSFKKTDLTNKQVASAIALLTAGAKRLNMSLSNYVDKTFGNKIFGSQEDFAKAANLQGDTVSGKAGGVNPGVAQSKWQDFGQSVKAVIYAGENADFSTWAHELAHIFQNQLEGDLKAQAEKAFNVIDGDWINSKYTFKDGHVDSAAEAFAYGFQDWLKTGKAESEELKNIFEKFAEFIARAFNSLKEFINLTPEIESVYNQLLSGDDSLLAKAEKAVEESDRAYRQSMQDQKQQEAEKAKADEEKAKQAEAAEREEKSETTDFVEKEQTTEEAAAKVEDIINDTETEKSDNAIDNAIENTNASTETKEKVKEVLNDENATQIDKAEAVTEITGEEYKALGDMLFQMTQEVGEEKAQEAFNQIMGKGGMLFQEITTEELNKYFNDLKPSEESKKYKTVNYDNVSDLYVEKTFKTSNGNNLVIKTPKGRKAKQHEIDEAYYLQKLGNKVAFLNEPATEGGHPDLLLNDNLIVELKQITGNINTATKKIREAINKTGVDIPIIFFMDKAVELTNEELLESLGKETHIKRNVNNIVIVRNYDSISLLNKKAPGTAFAEARRTSNIAQQIEEVKQKYQNTDKWLKAPNGEDTLLSEKQWLQVRTENFKKWFGDWENDPANASKVLDENGEPLVVYHGTTEDFNVFDATKTRANMDIQGNFFSPWEVDAQGYGPNLRAFFLNMRNPANFSAGLKALHTYTGQNEAGVKARELLKSQGYDGVNNDNEEYIAFDANQIKSATDNNGNFDANNSNILFQIAGEIGAQNLDNSEEVKEGVSRMQNLAIAKEMEAESKDAKAIRLATGWEKSDDGKWRYEIDDSKISVDFDTGMKAWESLHPEYKQLMQRILKLEELSEEERNHFEELNKEHDEIQENKSKEFFKLDEVLNYPELYKAYPTLKNVDVYIGQGDEDGVLGEYEPGINTISLYTNQKGNSYANWEYEAKRTLLHEIQHIIQKIEGFAVGGDIYAAGQIIDLENQKKAEIKNKAFAWEWKIELEKQEEKHPDLKGNLALMNSLIDEYTENGKFTIKELEEEHWLPDQDVRIKGFNLYVRGYDKAGYEDAYKEWQEKASKKGIKSFEPLENSERNKYDFYRRFAGEVESRNVERRINLSPAERINILLKETEDVNPVDKIILFQTVYHGSGANFEKFNTEQYGLSGEGSMSFGYGTYVTDSEEIARDYAERNRKQFDKYADNPYERGTLEREIFEDLRSFDFDKTKYKAYLEQQIKDFKAEPYNPYIDNKASGKLSKLDSINATNLYTVEIPDNGYIVWDKKAGVRNVRKIAKALEEKNKNITYWLPNHIKDLPMEDKLLYTINNQSKTGKGTNEDLYEALSIILGNEKEASKFLHSLGYVGIKYPAGTIHGNGNGAYNYVIFDDEDAKIIDHLLFQTQAELLEEAKSFDTWQEFMDFYETMGKPEVTPIPYDAAAQWYQSFWEMAHGMQTEQEKNEQTVADKVERDGTLPPAMDALFATRIKTDPKMLDDFLKMAAWVDAIDFDSEEWKAESAEDAQDREKYERLKDFISFSLYDYNWQTAMRRIRSGNEISEGLRKRLLGEITDNFKARDFRALYAELMEDKEYAVAEEDTIAYQLDKKLQKYQKRYYDILKPNEDISRVSPERRKQIAEAMANRDIANKIANGSLKLDDELDNYIKSLKKQADDAQKRADELEAETKADYQRIADAERRKLLKIHEELLLARSKLKSRNDEVARKVNKGLKITEKYGRESQNLQANYNELFRKFEDLKNSIQINAEVNAALERQEQLAGLKEDLNAKKKEQNLTAEIKKMRIQLVKRTMRRVPFNRIDYNNARTVIAIQRILEPNLIGGVNKFIGIDSPYLRGVISQIVTDKDFKEKILRYLSKSEKSSQAFVNFKKKIEEMKSVDDLNTWTRKEREYAIKHLPKENWIRDLNLEQLAQEREESIDLDIGTEEVRKPVIDPKTGAQKVYKVNGEDVPAYEVSQRITFSNEIAQEVRDAVGQDMFDLMVNVPFSEWTTEQLETLAKRVDELYTEGRELLAAKNEARKREAEHLRNLVEDAIKETGITINDDDTPEEKKEKLAKINKILGKNKNLKGTEAGKDNGIWARLDRLLHGYSDMNVLRFARMLDNNVEGINTRLLYRQEDTCFNAKQRSINARTKAVYEVMEANNITEADLAKQIKVKENGLDTSFTVDELLYFLAADKDYELDDKGRNDNYAATSRNAVMFGNMMSDNESQEKKELWDKADKDMKELIENDALSAEQRQLLAIGQLDKTPGTTAYVFECNERWKAVIGTAQNFIDNHPKYKALMEAIEGDYAEQYERMNEISITEFNQPVHRVKAYVPLVRRESNGDTNVNQVKEDLLGAFGAEAGKQWVNKGMTQRRQNISPLHQKPVQTGLFATWGSSIERTEHFIAYAPYVRQLNAVYKSRDAAYTRRYLEARYGKPAIEYLDSYINEVANPNANKIREKGAEFLHALRGRTAPAYLGWKFSAVIKQGLTSPFPYMQFVNPVEYFAALSDFTHKETREMILEKSAFMRSRSFDPLKDLVEEMADSAKSEKGRIGEIDRWWTEFGRIGMKGLEMIDWACVSPGWLACYKKEYAKQQKMAEARYNERLEELQEKNAMVEVGTSEWLSEDQIKQEASRLAANDIELAAVQYADDCTRQCQPSSRAADLAPLFKKSSEAMKAFLQFQTSLNVIWQNIRYDIPYAVKNRQFDRIAYTVIGYVMAGIFMNGVMDGLTDGADDDDDKKLQALRNIIFYSTTQFTDAIPMIGSEVTNTMDQLITGKRGFAQSGTDMTPSATKILAGLTKASTGDFKKAAILTAEGIGIGIGAPVSGVKEINKLLGRPLKEGDVNLLRGVSDVYGITGDIMDAAGVKTE